MKTIISLRVQHQHQCSIGMQLDVIAKTVTSIISPSTWLAPINGGGGKRRLLFVGNLGKCPQHLYEVSFLPELISFECVILLGY